MNLRRLPIVEQVFESGARDRVFDALLLAGPPAIVLLALLGRSVVTTAIAIAYLGAFVVHVVHNGFSA